MEHENLNNQETAQLGIGAVIGSAYFTKFESGANWCDGKIGKYNFQAKLFDEGSTFGIKDGMVSKLAIWDEEIRQKEQNFLKASRSVVRRLFLVVV